MAVNINDTRTMLAAIERGFKPSSLLVDTFFPKKDFSTTKYVDIEYRKGGRKMAPFVVSGGKGTNSARTNSVVHTYQAPLLAPKRVLTVDDAQNRGFGENIYSQRTAEEREMEIRARDLLELQDEIARRKEWMAAQLLINGSYEIAGYADDGKQVKIDTVSFDFTNKTILSGGDTWDNATAKIYDMLGDTSQSIRRNAGAVPTIAICSENVKKYLLANEQLYKQLLIPSRENLALMSLQPRIVSPEVIRFGFIESLNLELYTYDGGYTDENDDFKTYIPDNHIIIGVPGRGRQLFGAVSYVEDNGIQTYEGEFIPKHYINKEDETTCLKVSSRPVLAPESVDDWAVLKVK